MRLLRPGSLGTVLGAALGVACLAFATPAWATSNQLSDKPVNPASADNKGGNDKSADNNPPGNNGTVKIDEVPVDDSVQNDPHVTCQFAVKFFGFDKGQTANIVFYGKKQGGWSQELLRRNNVVISKDAAGGAANDLDEIFTYSVSDLNLSGITPQPQQGYHIKLSVELASGTEKHKVFWLQPCASPSPSKSGSSNGGGGNNGGGNNGGGNNGGSGSENGGGTTPSSSAQPSASPSTSAKLASNSLPVTGTAVAGVVTLGLVLVAAGAGTLAVRRRALKFKA